MKKERFLIGLLVMALTLGLGAAAYAVPSLGVGTGNFDCTGASEYWECFDGALVSGGTFESFALPASSVTDGVTLWADTGHPKVDNYNIWLLAEPSIGTFTFDGAPSTSIPATVAFGSYVNPYQGLNLGPANASPWTTGSDPFFGGVSLYTGTLTYTGTDVEGDWLFLVSDSNGTENLQGNESHGPKDHFSPKTTSAVGVPEPSTLSMAVVGGIILIVGIIVRRRAYGTA